MEIVDVWNKSPDEGLSVFVLGAWYDVEAGVEGSSLSSSFWPRPSKRSRMPLRRSRDIGAGFVSWLYSGIGGAEVMRFVRTLISRFGWIMVIFMLKGATSYARLC